MAASANAAKITDVVDTWKAQGSLDADAFDGELFYFRNRYFADGELTHRFPYLNLRKPDHPELVEAVIKGVSNEPRDRVLAILIIIWRLRNNLFHGAKWAYQLQGQRENFTNANAVLMRLLEAHGQVA